MSRTLRIMAAAAVALLCASAAPGADLSADQQLAFATELSRSGDGELAILEFRRFIFVYPTDPRVPDARFAIARAYLAYAGSVGAAHRELRLIIAKYPQSQAAARAEQLDGLIMANSKDGYRSVILFFHALGARERPAVSEALGALDELVKSYPQSTLAPDGLLLKAQILEANRRVDEAIAAYAELPTRYPGSPLEPCALLGQARAIEGRDGPSPQADQLYGTIVTRHPNSPEAAEARKHAGGPRHRRDAFQRQFRADDIQAFRVLQGGYGVSRTLYESHIEVPAEISEDEVQATLEDALIKSLDRRADPRHTVRVIAYSAGSKQRAGVADWAPTQKPRYEIDRVRSRDKKDRLRGVLEGLMK